MQDDEQLGEEIDIPCFKPNDEVSSVLYQRGKELFDIESDDWVWNYLFDIWFNPQSKIMYTTLSSHCFKQYRNACLRTMIDRIFRDYFISNKDQTSS